MHQSFIRLIGVIAVGVAIAFIGESRGADDAETRTAGDGSASQFPAEELEFFEQKIRPVLVEHCLDCHSQAAVTANRLKGGLQLDSRAALLRGGDSGPAAAPGKSAESLLLKALQYEELQMPPKGKLSKQVLADFERWIDHGLADPRVETASTAVKGLDLTKGREHWAYRPLSHLVIPELTERSVPSFTPTDAFIRASLNSAGIEPSPLADRQTLVRRVFLDLIGLPPSPEELQDFLKDEHADAYERLIDRLLASPHFGVRWGRHWLSVARFGESLTLRGFILPEAWRYRDYVIEAFNQGMPFDQFVIEQLAGDLLPAETLNDQQRQRIATTYLTLGNLNLEEQDKQQLRMDVVDEQLDVIGKGLLAQTITCARCHDHKFDPIPTRDYYAMAGILANVKTLEHANVSKWLELSLPLEPAKESMYAANDARIADVQSKMKTLQAAKQQSTPPTVIVAKDLPGIVVDDSQATIVGDWELSQSIKPYVGRGYLHDKNVGKGEKTVTLLPELPHSGLYEVRFAYTPGANRSAAVPVTVMSADGEKTITVNEKQSPAIDGLFVSLGQFRFEKTGQSFVIVSTSDTKEHVVVDAVQFLPMELTSPDAPADKKAVASSNKTDPKSVSQFDAELKALQQELKELQAALPPRPRYMSVQEETSISDLRIHIRGTVHNLGETVPRGFLQVVQTGNTTHLTSTQSGRRELGAWIVRRDNPLTPRVLSNRVWNWLFGAGISRTPENFGTTGDAPSHPELLDYLSERLLVREWSVKPLIREVVASYTYRQSSLANSAQGAVDPENRWLSRQNRRRIDAEALLDAILTVSGRRNDEFGGPTILGKSSEDYRYVHRSNRRAVYWPVLRNALPEIFDAFDFADPSLPSGTRNVSTVAPQALFFLNNEWVTEHVRDAARQIVTVPSPHDAARIDRVFLVALGRLPTDSERQITEHVLASEPDPQTKWMLLIRAMIASIDFRFVE
ncbi:DUF1549 domain-containing protein [Schlesneria paludicola]|uniref:DUF1549 domain-containing protein n=1 Tax=Schlesneria paludicola TaxID=360056 RepID=UPI00029AAF96|nr:DUF1549 domain-containing protein [Schlesneria paludicola]